jgi:hypothetical protein
MTVLSTTMSQDDIHQAGLQALHRELGLVGMVRFIQQFDPGSADCTAEQADMTMDDAIAAVQKVRAEGAHAPKPLAGSPRSGTLAADVPDDRLRAKGVEALRRELGPRAFVLFLRQFVKPSGDYTAERAALIGHLTVDEISERIKARQAAETLAPHQRD